MKERNSLFIQLSVRKPVGLTVAVWGLMELWLVGGDVRRVYEGFEDSQCVCNMDIWKKGHRPEREVWCVWEKVRESFRHPLKSIKQELCPRGGERVGSRVSVKIPAFPD